jgi:hypothetical protein
MCAPACQVGLQVCGGLCTNPQNDPMNCGGCNLPCATGQVCQGGMCASTCAAPSVMCGSVCTNTQNDPLFCGNCNTVCAAGQGCVGGACQGTVCAPGAVEICTTGTPSPINIGVCTAGTKTCNATGTGYSACAGEVKPSPEVCADTLDNDCNGITSAPIFLESFANNNAGWTLGPEWAIGAAAASAACGFGNDPATDHSPSADNGVAGVALGACYATALHGDQCITSPNVNTATPGGSVWLSYWRSLHSDYPPYMSNHVDVSKDGGTTWGTVYSVPTGQGQNDNGWAWQNFDITNYKSATTRVRWCHAVLSTGIINGGGWNIDDVAISSNEGCQ